MGSSLFSTLTEREVPRSSCSRVPHSTAVPFAPRSWLSSQEVGLPPLLRVAHSTVSHLQRLTFSSWQPLTWAGTDRQLGWTRGSKSNKLNPRTARHAVGRGPGIPARPRRCREGVAEAGCQAGGGSEGWVVDAPGDPRVFFRCEAVGRRRIHGRQTQDWLQNNLQGDEGAQSLLRARHWHRHPRAGSVPGQGVTQSWRQHPPGARRPSTVTAV